ncbi:MAG: hypothetical protein AVDCRST_MAG77-3383, partial [uncultured Chloroflexi bacterium]
DAATGAATGTGAAGASLAAELSALPGAAPVGAAWWGTGGHGHWSGGSAPKRCGV